MKIKKNKKKKQKKKITFIYTHYRSRINRNIFRSVNAVSSCYNIWGLYTDWGWLVSHFVTFLSLLASAVIYICFVCCTNLLSHGKFFLLKCIPYTFMLQSWSLRLTRNLLANSSSCCHRRENVLNALAPRSPNKQHMPISPRFLVYFRTSKISEDRFDALKHNGIVWRWSVSLLPFVILCHGWVFLTIYDAEHGSHHFPKKKLNHSR